MLLVDDDPLVIAGLRLILAGDANIEIVGDADHGDTRPDAVRHTGSSLRWYDDEPRVSDVALYDMTAQGATTLASVLIERQLATADEREREYWAARVRLVNQQRTALDPDDRLGLIAQQQAWLDEIDAAP